MALFSAAQIEQINKVAEKSREIVQQPSKKTKSITSDIDAMSAQVVKYFADSQSILITSEDQLAEYIDKAIEAGYCGIDTETTGLDRIKDTIVGSSLYYPGGVECYIPNKHKIPIFDDLRKNQLTYEQCQRQFQRLVDAKCKMIFANADFDIAMIYKDYKVDFIPACYYDCILAWRCIKEDELHNGLKELYNKYVLRGKGDPKKFNDFFDVALFPYCKPEVAKLYAANDAKITYELFRWQLPYITKGNPKCTKNHLEKIADVVWGIEFPMIRVCAMMHRVGSFIDSDVAKAIDKRYDDKYNHELEVLQQMVQTLIDDRDIPSNSKRPFRTGKDFNPTSVTHARYLCYNLLNVPTPTSGKEKGKQATSKEVLAELNLPETNQLLKVRSLSTLIGTFVKKLPKTVTPDGRIHAQFRSVGAATGRMCIAEGTLITCLNGQKPIEAIKPGDLVYCYDMNGNLHLAPVKNLWLTGENRECVDIKWQSSGSGDIGHLICTPEHRILTKSGEWVEAKDLKRHMKLAHLRRTVTPPEYRPTLYGWNDLCTREQDVIKFDIFGAPSSMIVHHDDEN
ncbi:MAG: DNA polymerase, partial [Ruminococcus flavefaciens]|nr:DNA polymerase [Ruminococcus flavefaciens]